MDYIRQMYHLNVLFLEKDQCQSINECFLNLLGDLQKLETNPKKQHVFLFIFLNIKEIQSDYLLLFKTYYIRQLCNLNVFYPYKTINNNQCQTLSK